MGLFDSIAQKFANYAIRRALIAALNKNCPAHLAIPLRVILENDEALELFQRHTLGCIRNPEMLTVASIYALPMPYEVKQVLAQHPDAVQYLVNTAYHTLRTCA